MNFFKHSTWSDKTRTYMTYLIYCIFIGYSSYLIFTASTMQTKISITILSIIFFSIAALGEYLKYLYRNMIKALAFDCDPNKALKLKHTMIKKDYFKGYKNTLLIFDTLYLCDVLAYDKNIHLLKENEKIFHSSSEYLLIYNYTLFYAYYNLNNKTQVKKHYADFIKMKNSKRKDFKLKPLYSWEFVDGVYYASIKDYKKSKSSFRSCNIDNMNRRELLLYYFEYAKACIASNDMALAKNLLHVAKDLNGKSPLSIKINQLLETL